MSKVIKGEIFKDQKDTEQSYDYHDSESKVSWKAIRDEVEQ